MLKHQHHADEVLQDAYVEIWNNADRYRAHISKAMTWMTAIVRYRALDKLSEISRNTTESVDDIEAIATYDTPEKRTLGDKSLDMINRCLKSLREQHRQCIELAYIYGFTYQELATKLDLPQGTVKVWTRRGMEKLRQCLHH